MQSQTALPVTLTSCYSNINECSDEFNNNRGILRQMIEKKTKRGRKSKNELPHEERCEICLEFIRCSLVHLIKCTLCQVEFHHSCYKHTIPKEESFVCERCVKAQKEGKSIESYKCDGVLYEQPRTGQFYHQICLRFIPEICEECNEEEISKNTIRRWRYKNSCKYCREKLSKSKAVIKCSNPKCKSYYHIPCAIQKGMIFSTKYQTYFFGIKDNTKAIPFFCCGHNKKLAAAYRNDVINQGKPSFSSKTELSSKDTTEENSEFDNEELYSTACSNALNLNFNEMIENSQGVEEREPININYISPKDIIPFEFNYQEIGIEECSRGDRFSTDLIYEIKY